MRVMLVYRALWIDQVSGETNDFVFNGSLDLSLEWETSPRGGCWTNFWLADLRDFVSYLEF